MSYQVLARRWRPRQFSEVVGQQHVLRPLVNALHNNTLHHAYLFTGTRGVGKTTLARILAKSINCVNGVSATPCGICENCKAIDAGRFVDMIEVDAASRTKVEDTRELLENVPYAPAIGRYKVYLIDEVHMLSRHSFNALLKTLEEPPAHIKFLFATTDPQNLLPTILSRCLQLNLKQLEREEISTYLGKILQEDSVEHDPPVLWEIATAARGSMRDALSILDQALAYGNGVLRQAEVQTMLGTLDRGRIVSLLKSIAAADGAALMQEVAQLAQLSPDYLYLLNEINHRLQQIALLQQIPDLSTMIADEHEALATLAASLNPADIQLYYQIGIHGVRDYPLAPTPRAGFEMTLLRMLAFAPQTRPAALVVTGEVTAELKKKSLTR
ncbi:MAG: DNA polymerase III subunit gamma/tau [Gammaproteobacteria bacterium]|nr:DNA polymerase III subunit gamma/tau [Gammaproteobacteria bacterium]